VVIIIIIFSSPKINDFIVQYRWYDTHDTHTVQVE